MALMQADMHVARAEAAAAGDGLLESAWLLVARAERTRAGGSADPAAYAAAADAWAALERPYPAAVMRYREAEAHVNARRSRGGDGRRARGARRRGADRRRMAAQRDRRPCRTRAARRRRRRRRARGRRPPVLADDPFGLTPRERQVLELVARGATNREIGAELFMAEKTASVHVSRILAKLDVRSRTEAAGVAHRLGLAG